MWESRLSGSVRGWGTTDVWPRYCGTTGKPGGNRENKHRPAASGVPSLLDKNSSSLAVLGKSKFFNWLFPVACYGVTDQVPPLVTDYYPSWRQLHGGFPQDEIIMVKVSVISSSRWMPRHRTVGPGSPSPLRPIKPPSLAIIRMASLRVGGL